MLQPQWVLLIGVVIAFLAWVLWKQFAGDGMKRINDERRATCRLVGRAEFVDGNRHIPVALAVDESTLFYENPDWHGTLDLAYVEEVEYEDELMTGQSVGESKVLRLRCFSKVFEFVLDRASAGQWQSVLPAVRMAR